MIENSALFIFARVFSFAKSPCCIMHNKREPWSYDEDAILKDYIRRNGPKFKRKGIEKAGLRRSIKCCRARWVNYLRPGLKQENFTKEEDDTICTLYEILGNRWAEIAEALPGRSDQAVRNRWTRLANTFLRSENSSFNNNKQITKFMNTCSNIIATPKTQIIEKPDFCELVNWYIMTPPRNILPSVSAAVAATSSVMLDNSSEYLLTWPETGVWDLGWNCM